MEIIQNQKQEKPKLQLAIHMARRNCEVSVDASYSNKSQHKAGAGAIITNPKRQNEMTLIQAFDMAQMDIQDSKYAELWGALLILEQLKNFNITKLTFDCSFIKSRLLDVMNGTLNEDKYQDPIFDRLKNAAANQNDMDLNHVPRNDENIKLVDRFSRVATRKNNADSISSIVTQYDAPFILHRMSNKGHIAQTTFYDAYDDYAP